MIVSLKNNNKHFSLHRPKIKQNNCDLFFNIERTVIIEVILLSTRKYSIGRHLLKLLHNTNIQ